METSRFYFLKKHFSAYEINFSKERDRDLVEIINPFYDENIRVEYIPEDDFTPYVVSFAFQHCHMCDEEDIVEYVNDIIDGKILSIEFFKNGARCFGGDIATLELADLSYDALAKSIEDWGIAKLLDYADSFKLRGWHSNYSFDAAFVIDENGLPTIKKH